jgi:hypothetical protein
MRQPSFLPTWTSALRLSFLRNPHEFPPESIRKGRLIEILKLHGRPRISISLSISDAISRSVLEAMVMGAFPIQRMTIWEKVREREFSGLQERGLIGGN